LHIFSKIKNSNHQKAAWQFHLHSDLTDVLLVIATPVGDTYKYASSSSA